MDLACGEGYNTRILARKEAKVVGVDFSKKLIEGAKQLEDERTLGIDYYVCDAADLRKISSNYFDVVTCVMALMDIEDYEDAIREVARVMKKKGRFIFSITHPCFEWGITMANGCRINVNEMRRLIGIPHNMAYNIRAELLKEYHEKNKKAGSTTEIARSTIS